MGMNRDNGNTLFSEYSSIHFVGNESGFDIAHALVSRVCIYAFTISSRDCIGNGMVMLYEQLKKHFAQAFPDSHIL